MNWLVVVIALLALDIPPPAIGAEGGPGVGTSTRQPRSAGDRAGPSAAQARGEPKGLRLEADTLFYCDERGGQAVDLPTGKDVPGRGAACPARDEPNTSCSGLGLDVAVRAPLDSPDDIVELDGSSVPVKGRVRDCALQDAQIAVATGARIVIIDVATGRSKVIDRGGGDRVVLGPNWIAWSTGTRLKWASQGGR